MQVAVAGSCNQRFGQRVPEAVEMGVAAAARQLVAAKRDGTCGYAFGQAVQVEAMVFVIENGVPVQFAAGARLAKSRIPNR